MTWYWVVIVAAALAGGFFLWAYNALVSRRNQYKEAWSDIDVQLKRRHDLIPNLISTVKGYAAHEREAFDAVTKARSQAIGATTPQQHAQAENALSATLKSLFAVAENYPELKANTNFLELQRELSDTENKIQAARRFYNTVVRDYNTMIESVPTNIVAALFTFSPAEFFELDDETARILPQVNF
jgi:LemA protein